MTGERVERVEAQAFTIPTDVPESDGTYAWHATTLVVVTITCGRQTGLGYTYAHACLVELITSTLAALVVGRDACDIAGTTTLLQQAIRNLGHDGLAQMAVSAVDCALWDLKAKLLDCPLVSLLGACRQRVPIYGSGGFTSYDDHQLAAQLGGWAGDGLGMVKMKIGREPARDLQRIQVARASIGADVQLFVDANGAYQPQQALSLAEDFRRFGVTWFEEPVPSQEVARMRWLRRRLPAGIELAGGEYQATLADARNLLTGEGVDVLQADATRCGGITGFLATGALCEAFATPLSAHCAPALHLHLGCALPAVRHLEYFHDHVLIERRFFDGLPQPQAGCLEPDLSRPGLGLELKRQDLERYVA